MNLKEFDEFRLDDAVKLHTSLNPKIFDSDGYMRSDVRNQLLEIAEDFINHLGIDGIDVKDIIVTGSNAAYTYTRHSDIDLHLIVDIGKLKNDDVYRELFNAKKVLYNDTHDIKVRGYDVELYVEDLAEPAKSKGEYSVLKGKWNRFPSKQRSNLDELGAKSKFIKLVQLAELALRSKDGRKVDTLLQTLRKYRQAGLTKHGEFGPENLAYKAIRSRGILDKLWKHWEHLHSVDLSLKERVTDEDWHPNDTPPGPESKPTMPRGTVRVDVSDVYDWYKLGQHISNLHGLGKHDFGKGPPSTIMSFGDEDTEHRYIKDLEATGLTTTDIDPFDPKQPKGMKRQKVDPTFNVAESDETSNIVFKLRKGKSAFALDMIVNGEKIGNYQYSTSTGRHIAEIYPEFQSKGYGKILVLKALETANKLGMDFIEDESRTEAYDNVIDSLENQGYVIRDNEYLYLTRDGENFLKSQINESASGYIPSNAERDDPRFKTGLTVDVKPDSIKKNAKKLGLGNIHRGGVPPIAKANGSIK